MGCGWAPTASGHAAAVPPSKVRNDRLLMKLLLPAEAGYARRKTGPAFRDHALLNLGDAGLGDDVAILGDLGVMPLLHLVERHPHRIGACGLETLPDLRV